VLGRVNGEPPSAGGLWADSPFFEREADENDFTLDPSATIPTSAPTQKENIDDTCATDIYSLACHFETKNVFVSKGRESRS
jgi:hypothetical protein